jgi:hypothetical protein
VSSLQLLAAVAIALVFVFVALWQVQRSWSTRDTTNFHLVRIAAVVLYVLAAFMELNAEVTSRVYSMPFHPSMLGRIEEFAPFAALIVLLRAPFVDRGGARWVVCRALLG